MSCNNTAHYGWIDMRKREMKQWIEGVSHVKQKNKKGEIKRRREWESNPRPPSGALRPQKKNAGPT